MPRVSAALAAHIALLVCWWEVRARLPNVGASFAARFAGVLGVAAGYISHHPVRDGVLDVPLVGFYATTLLDALPGSCQRS